MKRSLLPLLSLIIIGFVAKAQTPFTQIDEERAKNLHLKNYAVTVAEASDRFQRVMGHELRSGMFHPDGRVIKSKVAEVDYVYAVYDKEFQYDELDRVVRENRTETLLGSEGPIDKPDSAYIRFEYEGAKLSPTYSYYHNIVRKEDLEQYGMQYYYDQKNRLERISHFDLNVEVEAVQISVVEKYEYDDAGNLVKEIYQTREEREKSMEGTVKSYTYNEKGLCTEKVIQYPNPDGPPIRKKEVYEYDDFDRIVKVTFFRGDNKKIRWNQLIYDSNGLVVIENSFAADGQLNLRFVTSYEFWE